MKRTTLDEQSWRIKRQKAARKIAGGKEFAVSNSGKKRTESKKALLRSIRTAAKASGRGPTFASKS